MKTPGALLLAAALLSPANLLADLPQFEAVEIDPHCGDVCYAVTVADVNGDDRTDVVAVTENRVLWYENPTWQPHVIIADQTERDNVCIAPLDIDGDGQVDFALGAGWTKIGTIQWLARNQSLDEPWNVYMIGEEPWLHRMRFADVLGTGRPQLVVSPLNQTQGDGVRLMAFEIPENPRTDRWQPTVLNDDLNRLHNHWHVEMDLREPIDTLAASEEGVTLITRENSGFKSKRLVDGAEGDQQGAGEVKVGWLAGRIFLATIEPMHGNMVVVYRGDGSGTVERKVIDDSYVQGHALWCADLDGDGDSEIVAGHRDTDESTPNVRICLYEESPAGDWRRTVLDEGGVAVEDLVVSDLDEDGRPDIIAGGRATHNVKIYWNRGPAAGR